jgi:hypothetical protein
MHRAIKIAGALLCVCAVGCLVWTFCFIHPQPPSNPKPYVRVEFKAASDEAEKTRTLKFIDEHLRQVEIRFADGSLGHRYLDVGPDGKSRLSAARETHDDKSWFTFSFDDKGKLAGVVGYRPDSTKQVMQMELPGGKTITTFTGPDGAALVATLLLGEADYVFTVYEGATGHERKLYVEEYRELRKPGEYNSSIPSYIITRTVFEDGVTPAYRQVWNGWIEEDEGGSSGGLGNGNPADNLTLGALEFFHEDTLLVRQRAIFGVSFELAGKKEDGGTEVHMLDTSGKETSVRYLTKENQVVKTVDKTKTPEITIVTPKEAALTETFDANQMKSPVSEAMAKLRDGCIMNGIGVLHLDRLLAD